MTSTTTIWKFRLLFGLGLYLLICGNTAPVFPLIAPIPRPDFIYCFMICWLVRQPASVSIVAVVTASLTTELLLLKTPGLWSALLLALCQYYFDNHERIRAWPFWLEWAFVVFTFALAQAICHLLLEITFLPAATVPSIFLHIGVTAIAYPPVVLMSNWVFRVTKPRSWETRMFNPIGPVGDTN
ncbi:MAG: hypothetical protein OXC53_00445 [Rhodobacteraceae bacterium]|nr:hypothetical protein [Paracoccaceae bacterium]